MSALRSPDLDAEALTTTPRRSVRGALLLSLWTKMKIKNLYYVPEVVYRLKRVETGLFHTEQVKIIYGST